MQLRKRMPSGQEIAVVSLLGPSKRQHRKGILLVTGTSDTSGQRWKCLGRNLLYGKFHRRSGRSNGFRSRGWWRDSGPIRNSSVARHVQPTNWHSTQPRSTTHLSRLCPRTAGSVRKQSKAWRHSNSVQRADLRNEYSIVYRFRCARCYSDVSFFFK